ncbi:hypothetical protein [Novipirellula aureliae]|nr:hypothetical protein [Novipirellula aureliae]
MSITAYAAKNAESDSKSEELFAGLFWLVTYFHFADTVWIPSWGRGRDFVDRIGIAIKGVGFAMISVCTILSPSIGSVVLGIMGLIVLMFGRILWELLLIDG